MEYLGRLLLISDAYVRNVSDICMYGTYSILFRTGQSDLQHINGGADVFDPGHGYGIRSTLSLDLTATRDH